VDFPPYKIAPGQEARSGIDVEIIEAAFAGSSYQPDFDFMPFKRAIELAARGDYAGICGCSYSAARAENFVFSDPVDIVSLGVFAMQDVALADIDSVEDLKGRDVIVVNGYVLEKELENVGAIVSLVPTDKQAAIMLSHHSSSLLASYRLPVEYWRARAELTEQIFYRELSSGPNHLCLSRQFPQAENVLGVFNTGLKRLTESGAIDQIRQRYDVHAALPVN
jgi:polar amino acid transport system substrate-binding protein